MTPPPRSGLTWSRDGHLNLEHVIRWKFRGCLPRMLFRGCHDVFQPRANPLAPDRQPTLSAPTTQIG
ncbi:unnamed protein product [Penicillium camemberti]|uniref:Str. FM013 n=1 Tax=Penicillium camemberti (strain FM 013) TaxID=1429867 RepID=A0A0G4PAP5_PENC3|nr:unnamed protein product [Penicillium camemberti]